MFFPPLSDVWVLVLNASPPCPVQSRPVLLPLLLLPPRLTHAHRLTHTHRLTYTHRLAYTH